MELWDVYDVHRVRQNREVVRGQTLQPGDYHLVVHLCLFNSQGQMLIQQRQKNKDGWPNLWDLTVGGSALRGESSQQAVERELAEELGLHLNLSQARPHMTVNFPDGFDDVYLIEEDIDLNTLSFQPEEVQAARWADQDDILAMIENETFLPYFPDLIRLIFVMRRQYGWLRHEDLSESANKNAFLED